MHASDSSATTATLAHPSPAADATVLGKHPQPPKTARFSALLQSVARALDDFLAGHREAMSHAIAIELRILLALVALAGVSRPSAADPGPNPYFTNPPAWQLIPVSEARGAGVTVLANVEDTAVVVEPSMMEVPSGRTGITVLVRDIQHDGDPHAFAWGEAALVDGGRIAWSLPEITFVTWSDNGTTVALLSRSHRLYVSADLASPREVAGFYAFPAVSPDGTNVIAQQIGSDGEHHILRRIREAAGLALVDVRTTEATIVLPGNDAFAPSFLTQDLIAFGSTIPRTPEAERLASLFVLDTRSGMVARVTNRDARARQAFPNRPPTVRQSRLILDSEVGRLSARAPSAGDFTPASSMLFDLDAPRQPVQLGLPAGDWGTTKRRRSTSTCLYIPGKTRNIYNYRDNLGGSGIKDWSCGTLTYNGHEGHDAYQPRGYNVPAPAKGNAYYTADGCPSSGYLGSTCGGGFGNHVRIDYDRDHSVDVLAHGLLWSVQPRGAKACAQTLMKSASSGSSNADHVHHEANTSRTLLTSFDLFQGPCQTSAMGWVAQGAWGLCPGTGCQ